MMSLTGSSSLPIIFSFTFGTKVYHPSKFCFRLSTALVDFYKTEMHVKTLGMVMEETHLMVLPIPNFGFFVAKNWLIKWDILSEDVSVTISTSTWGEVLCQVSFPFLQTLLIDLQLIKSETPAFISFLHRHTEIKHLVIKGKAKLDPGLLTEFNLHRLNLKTLVILTPNSQFKMLQAHSSVALEVFATFSLPQLDTFYILEGSRVEDLKDLLQALRSEAPAVAPAELSSNALLSPNRSRTEGTSLDHRSPAQQHLLTATGAPEHSKGSMEIPFILDLKLMLGRWLEEAHMSVQEWLESFDFQDDSNVKVKITLEDGLRWKTEMMQKLRVGMKGVKVPVDIQTTSERAGMEMDKRLKQLKKRLEEQEQMEKNSIPESGEPVQTSQLQGTPVHLYSIIGS
ncbi:hypothetical protein B0H10DRAFT_1950153 [Mycena sp. CBHHK59/15]|nr:hypothetical protein B0H10DRAFT_1950153 [Mycena sp. CBHHK59/15]